ncbi:LmeA family phospholipid-binding protein [Streptomyces sp. NPDC050803]|uniref:LmeA family phospholipid-binding protein n=1 Tax=unclassified Streptomyces TaxID=2593676 RepID=UPI003437A317
MIRAVFRRHRAASVTAVVLAVVLLGAVVAEVAARTLLHGRLTAAAGRALGQDVDVDVEGGPAVLDLFDRHLDAVTFTSGHAALGRIPDVSVQARLDDLRLTGGRSVSVARTHAEVEVPAASLQEMTGRLPVTGVRLDDRADTIALDLQGGLGRATLQPRLEDGHVTLRLEDAEFLGGPAPAALVDRIETGLGERTDADYPLGLTATAVDVTATGLSITLDGDHTRLTGATVAHRTW